MSEKFAEREKSAENVAAKEATTERNEAVVPGKVYVSVDNSFEEVLSYLKDGKDVFFLSSPGNFKELTDLEYAQLPRDVQDRYFVSRDICRREQEYLKNPKTAGLSVGDTMSTADIHMNVFGKRADKHYALKRPENVDRMLEQGFEVVTGKDGERMTNKKEGHFSVKNDELILMSTPKANQEAIKARSLERNRAMVGAQEKRMESDKFSKEKVDLGGLVNQ